MYVSNIRELTFNHGNLKQPIYDSQPTKYLAEDIFRLLLDTELDSKLICSEKPTSVSSSAAFKRDSYGKWKYSGSRPHFYFIKHLDNNQMKIEKREPGVSGDNIFQIRRLYCKHPSNDDFRRMIAIITGTYIMHCYL